MDGRVEGCRNVYRGSGYQGTDGKIYFDPDGILATAWKLPGANNNFTVIFINKNQVIEFYKAGQLTPEEQEQVIALVRKYSN